MKYFLLIILFSPLFSQPIARPGISGNLYDKSGEPLRFANVVLHSQRDSSVITGSTSDKDGRFVLYAPNGSYYLKISYLSMKTKFIDVLMERGGVDLGDIYLEPSSINAKEVIVEADKAYLEMQLDKRVVNVSTDPNNQGRNASDILDNIPSVQVDVEGQVSLRGSQNVTILIDGKPSGLIGRDPEQLRQLQGDIIEKVEVITNPSARYDAEGEVGIINIVLKKEKREGYSASFDLKGGAPDNHGISLNSNYRYSFYNLFSSVGVSWRRMPGFGDVDQRFFNSDLITYSHTDRQQERGGLGANFRVGSDFYINPKNVITTSMVYQYGDRLNQSRLTYSDYLVDNSLYQTTTRTDDEREEKNDIEFELDYESQFDSKDHKLSFISKFIQDRDLELSDLSQINQQGFVEDLTQRSSNLEFERNILIQLDYVNPFSEYGKFESGFKATLRKIDNDFTVEQLQNNQWESISRFDDNFIYYENIYAAYIMAGEKFGKFSFQGGLRTEYSDIETLLLISEYDNPRDYMNLFPSFHSSYQIADMTDIQISYARRIQRPRFRHLMPFSSYTDPRNFYNGNPDLDPEFTDSFEAGFLTDWSNGSFLSSAYYRASTNIIQRVTTLDSAGFTSIRPENIGTRDSYGIEFNLSYEPIKKLTFTANANFFRAITNGNESVNNLDADTYTWTGQFSAKTNTFYDIDFQFNLNYNAPQDIPQGRIKQIWWLDFAASKDILNDQATLTFSGRDVFSTRMRRMIMQDVTFYFDQDFQWRAGAVTLTFNYRLNSEKNDPKLKSGDNF